MSLYNFASPLSLFSSPLTENGPEGSDKVRNTSKTKHSVTRQRTLTLQRATFVVVEVPIGTHTSLSRALSKRKSPETSEIKSQTLPYPISRNPDSGISLEWLVRKGLLLVVG